MFFVAFLGNEERGTRDVPLHIERNNHLFGGAAEACAYLRDGELEKFLVTLVEFAFVLVGESLVDTAVGHVHVIDECHLSVAVIDDGEDVHVGDGVADHLAFSAVVFDEQIPLFQSLCLLKFQIGCPPLHLCVEEVGYLAGVTFQYLLGLTDALLVIFTGLFADAGSFAVMDVVFQAGFVFAFAYAFLRDGHAA